MEVRFNGGDQSLNTKIGENGEDDWQSLLADDRPTPEDVIIGTKDAATRSQWLKDALGNLNDREQKIIRDRHLTHETVTLEALGEQLGISKERVRQIESVAMDKLKSSLSPHENDIKGMMAEH